MKLKDIIKDLNSIKRPFNFWMIVLLLILKLFAISN
jgi:hypothetical protein